MSYHANLWKTNKNITDSFVLTSQIDQHWYLVILLGIYLFMSHKKIEYQIRLPISHHKLQSSDEANNKGELIIVTYPYRPELYEVNL